MATNYPLGKFRFKVGRQKNNLESEETVGFTEVSGLSYEIEVAEYRTGLDRGFSKVKIPGLRKFGNVTLKKGVIQGASKANSDFYTWISDGNAPFSVKTRTDYRRDIVIVLMDEANEPMVTWTLFQAFPIKVAFTDMKADANEVAIETLELAIEDLTVDYK